MFEFGESLHQGVSLEGLSPVNFVASQDISVSWVSEDTDPAGVVSLGPDMVTAARHSTELSIVGGIPCSPSCLLLGPCLGWKRGAKELNPHGWRCNSSKWETFC